MKLTAKFGEQEMKLQTKFGSSQTKIPSSVGSVTFVGGGGGGGECERVTSWNDLEDKPFDEEFEVKELVSNLTSEDYKNGNIPSCNFVVGNTYDVIWNGVNYSDLVCDTDGTYNFIGGEGYPFYIDDDGGGGFYVENIENADGEFTVSVIGKETTIKTLDEKYIPDTIARRSDSTSWNDLTDKPFDEEIIQQSFVDAVNILFINGTENIAGSATIDTAIKKAGGLIEGKDYLISVDGKMYECICVRASVSTITGTMYANELHSVGEHGVSVKYNGTMFRYYTTAPVADGSHSVAIYEFSKTVKTLDEKYIPDTIARKNDAGFVFVGTTSVGQGVVVKSVENGKPSEFEAVDMVNSYNDLTDVPVKETRTEVMAERKFIGTSHSFGETPYIQYNLVLFDGVEYKVQPQKGDAPASPVGQLEYWCGNPHLYNSSFDDNGIPFFIVGDTMMQTTKIFASTSGIHAISLYKRELKFLSEDLLPESVVLESELESKGYQNEEQVKTLINNSKSEIVNDVIASLPIYNGEVEKV